jgi:hypothetical protein
MGTTPDGTIVQGVDLSYFQVSKQDNNIGADTPAFTMITVQERIVDEWDVDGVWLKPSFLLQKLDSLTKVTVTASSVVSNGFTLTISYDNNSDLSSDGSTNSLPLVGLTDSDLTIIDQTSATLTPTTDYTVTDNNDGTYDVDATAGGLTSGSAAVKPYATSLYESDAVTLSA